MAMTKNQIRQKLEELGIEYSSEANKDELEEMLKEAEAQSTPEPVDDEGTLDGDLGDGDDKGDDEKPESEDKTPAEVPVRKGQATLVECLRQAQGIRFDGEPFEKTEEE